MYTSYQSYFIYWVTEAHERTKHPIYLDIILGQPPDTLR